ncbi:MAG: HD domain-containing protein [Spirochaetaceae bacterium]|jgi:putative nucleotidyltransferase with HDIG domain|nr:HD domain-containing protein [Spirochaetaceae bacterium]
MNDSNIPVNKLKHALKQFIAAKPVPPLLGCKNAETSVIANAVPVAPLFLREMGEIFNQHKRKAYLVGGAVRDMFMGKSALDYDIATDAPPGEVIRIFKRVIPTGIKHGTVTVRFKGRSVEVTTFRADGRYTDGRRPESVAFASTIEEDLSRRDFTFNAIALELPSGGLVDPFGGLADIERHLIRCVGAAGERFAEDGLRPLRALRFCARFPDFELDSGILAAIPAALSVTAKVSNDRIRDELNKMISCPAPLQAFQYMEKTGLLKLIVPELAVCRGVEQKGMHRFDVLDHSFYALEWACAQGYPQVVRLAALFHDIGKPAAMQLPAGQQTATFYNHEKESARLARAALFRLRYPNITIEQVVHLINEHMFHYEPCWQDAAVRRFIVRAGEAYIAPLFQLRMADAYAFTRETPEAGLLTPFAARILSVLEKAHAFSLKELAVNGNDLKTLGITDGKRIGAVLRALFDDVLAEPTLNNRTVLLERAGEVYGRTR